MVDVRDTERLEDTAPQGKVSLLQVEGLTNIKLPLMVIFLLTREVRWTFLQDTVAFEFLQGNNATMKRGLLVAFRKVTETLLGGCCFDSQSSWCIFRNVVRRELKLLASNISVLSNEYAYR